MTTYLSLYNDMSKRRQSQEQCKITFNYTKTMNTIFINSENSKTSKPHILMLKLANELDLRRDEKILALSNLSVYYTRKNTKSSYNNKFKISASTQIDKFELPDGLYSVSDIQDYFG